MKLGEWTITHPPKETLGSEHKASMGVTCPSGTTASIDADVEYGEGNPEGLPEVRLVVKFKSGEFKKRNRMVAELKSWVSDYLEINP